MNYAAKYYPSLKRANKDIAWQRIKLRKRKIFFNKKDMAAWRERGSFETRHKKEKRKSFMISLPYIYIVRVSAHICVCGKNTPLY